MQFYFKKSTMFFDLGYYKMSCMNEDIKDRVGRKRRELGLSQSELARRVKTSPQSIQQLEEGLVKRPRYIVELARALKVTPDWLSTGIGLEHTGAGQVAESSTPYGQELTMAGSFAVWDQSSPDDPSEVDVPLFREVELSAGSGRTQVIENHGAKLKFAKSSLVRAGVSKDHAACAYVSGDSMEPVLPDGSTVGVDTSDKRVRDGKLYAIDHDGMLRVKQLYRIPQGIRLRSFNASHSDEDYDLDYAEQNIRIIGRVFWYASFI